MEISFEWRGCKGSSARLGRLAKASVEEFFRHAPLTIPKISLTVLKAVRGGDGNQIIRKVPVLPEFDHHPESLPVQVHLEGSQGMICFLSVPNRGPDEVAKIIDGGPYKRKPRSHVNQSEADEFVGLPGMVSDDLDGGTTHVLGLDKVGDTPALTLPEALPAVVDSRLPFEGPPRRRLSPREKLQSLGAGDDEIERLMATLASIIHREYEGNSVAELPNTLQVRVKDITAAILDHMGLPYGKANNYRGVIGSFYSSRIALFALKDNMQLEEDDKYTDWLFDCDLVVDFVGGKDRLAALAREREVEVQARIERETRQEADPPPSAVKVEEAFEAVKQGFLPDNSIFELALKVLEGRRLAEQAVLAARANEEAIAQLIGEHEVRLTELRSQFRDAQMFTAEAVEKQAEFVLTPEVLEAVRAAKARIDKLAKELFGET